MVALQSSSLESPFPAPLSPHWAFVVQLRDGTALAPPIRGQVEHIISERAALFHSLEELRAFMERVLTASQKEETTEEE
ncbi:MAG: hypothetical protein L0H83_08865 [Salinisphaera sp.]|nr:hypothetical protein [Salinisphaera sp.]